MLWSEVAGLAFLLGAAGLFMSWMTDPEGKRPWLPLSLHAFPLGVAFIVHPVLGLVVIGAMGIGYWFGVFPKPAWINDLGASVPWWAMLLPVIAITIVISAELTRFALLPLGIGFWWATHHTDVFDVLGTWNIMRLKQTRYLGMIMIAIGGFVVMKSMTLEMILIAAIGTAWYWTDPQVKDFVPKAKKAFADFRAKIDLA